MAEDNSAILFSGSSVLRPVTRQKIVKLRETLKKDKLTRWFWFKSKGVETTDFYGGTVCQKGVSYEEQSWRVFLSFVKPFLEDAVVKTLNETLEICLTRKYEPEPYIRETAMLLDGHLIDPIYRYMAEIDRRLRGCGYPKNVTRRDVTREITEMVKFLDICKDEMIHGIKTGADIASVEEPTETGSAIRLNFTIWNKDDNYNLLLDIINDSARDGILVNNRRKLDTLKERLKKASIDYKDENYKKFAYSLKYENGRIFTEIPPGMIIPEIKSKKQKK